MSEQRKIRQEIRQGLHQFLMQLYVSYTETNGEDEAKSLIRESIEEQYAYFSPDSSLANDSAQEVLSSKVKELTAKMESVTDYDAQLYYAEKIDTLNAALEVLEYKITT